MSEQLIKKITLRIVLVFGGMWLLFSILAYPCVKAERIKNIKRVYESLQQTDMGDLLDAVEEEQLYFQEANIDLIICDSDFQLVYSSNIKKDDRTIERKIINHKQLYRKDAKPEMVTNATGERAVIRGILSSEQEEYYVYVYSKLSEDYSNILYAQFVLFVGLLIGIVGSVFIVSHYIKKVARVLQETEAVTEKLSEGKLENRIVTESEFEEIRKLSQHINDLAERLHEDRTIINNYRYLLEHQKDDMAELDVMQKRLVSSVTHQLKTPLAIISSQLELEFAEKDPEKKEYYVNSIMEEIDKMSDQIRDILNRSKETQSPIKVRVSRANISEFLEEMALKYESWLSSEGIVFEAQIEKGLHALIDPGQIEQAINNYMMNAYKYTKKGKKVTLRLMKDEDACRIEVHNEGTGIPEVDMDDIWKDYYQRTSEKTAKGNNVGLGLYIVKDIVRQHGGTCGVRNDDTGVVFWIRI